VGRNGWGPEGPPPEAYSRVTNPERFEPLHDTATKLLERLEREFDVERSQRYGLDAELEKRYQSARPSTRLLPRDAGAAPLIMAFSAFPGLHVRFGRWCMMAFPSCGCDACDETAEDEIERLTSLIDDLTTGRFREVVRLNPNEHASKEFWSADEPSTRQSFPLPPEFAPQLIAGGDHVVRVWRPWPRRA